MYFGEVGKRYELSLTLMGEYKYEQHFGWQTQYMSIYTMEDADGNVFVWKTSGWLGTSSEQSDPRRADLTRTVFDSPSRGDGIVVKATIKDHSEYNGTPQTVLTRVKCVSIDHKPIEQKPKASRPTAEEQIATLKGEDFVWDMPYRQYKDHYSDCETITGSYNKDEHTIKVIVREGRLVPSGVRGKTLHSYILENEDGKKATYLAFSPDNAEKRCRKDYGDGYEVVGMHW